MFYAIHGLVSSGCARQGESAQCLRNLAASMDTVAVSRIQLRTKLTRVESASCTISEMCIYTIVK